MLYLINDSAVIVRNDIAFSATSGGSSSFISGMINFLKKNNLKFSLVGNFIVSDINILSYQIIPKSNLEFILKLPVFLWKKTLLSNDILYFQRPDHLTLSAFRNVKKIIHLHGPVFHTIWRKRNKFERFIYFLLEYIALKNTNLLIVSDKRTYSIYCKKYPFLFKKSVVIPTGIDYEFFIKNDNQTLIQTKSNEKNIIYSGRLSYPKRIKDLIKIFKIVNVRIPEIKLHIAGDGQSSKELTNFVNESGLTDNVIFHGNLDKFSLKKLIYSCHAGVLLSYHEGSPLSVKEILACGKPVVVNDVGDVTDYVIHGKTGFIVNPDDPDEVAEAIIKAVTLSNEMEENCKEIVKKYDENIINAKIIDTIQKKFSISL